MGNIYHVDKWNPSPSVLKEWGVKAGWFVRHGGCSIWFEVLEVRDNYVICISRYPKYVTDMVYIGDYYGAIDSFSDTLPEGDWIKKDRTKNFYDKFNPEGWHSVWCKTGVRPCDCFRISR